MSAPINTELSDSAQSAKLSLRSFREKLEPIMQDYFTEQIESVSNLYTPHSVKALEIFKDVAGRGGKRLRGSFVYFIYAMYGGKKLKEALRMSLVIELVHAYALVIDDFMDISTTRRHGPSAHIMFTDYFKKKGFKREDPVHWGNSMAVLIGLMGFHMAMQVLNTLDFDPEIRIRLSQYLNRNTEVTAHGQIADGVNAVLETVTEEDVINMLKWKTGVYTYENPIHTGAILAGITDKKELETLRAYAVPAGIAFQMQDDILGMFGEESEIGKSVLDDLREGKYTLLVHKAIRNGDETQKKLIEGALGNPNLTKAQHEDVKKVIIDTGSLDYSRALAQKFVKEAQKALNDGHNDAWEPEGLAYLNGIADYMIERKV